jgi:hypothetical protein
MAEANEVTSAAGGWRILFPIAAQRPATPEVFALADAGSLLARDEFRILES